MSSLIFQKDYRSPFFKQNDTVVRIQSYSPNRSSKYGFPPPTSTTSILPTLSPKNKSIPSLSFQKGLEGTFSESLQPPLQAQTSQRSSPRGSEIPIELLYSPKKVYHSRNRTELLPPLSSREHESPPSTSRVKEMAPIQELPLKKSKSSAKLNRKVSKKRLPGGSPESPVLNDYLNFLQKTSKVPSKDSVKQKFNKLALNRSGKSIEVSQMKESNAVTAPSIQSIRGFLSPKNSALNISRLEGTPTGKSSSDFTKKGKANLGGETPIETSFFFREKSFVNHLSRMATNLRIYRNNYEAFFKVLAQNLNELFNLFSNEQKFQSAIEGLIDKNPPLLELIFPKNKTWSFEISKLEQKFATIEFVPDNIPIPVKLEKMRQGITLLEPSLLKELQFFNEKLEELLIKKKRDQLQQIGDRLIQTEENLKQILQKKIGDIRKKNRLKDYESAQTIISDRPSIGYYHFAPDFISIVENQLKESGELKSLKYKNAEYAKGLSEIFVAWRKHVNQ